MRVVHIATFNCRDCGQVTTRRSRSDRPKVCYPCGKARANAYQDALRQIPVKRWGANAPQWLHGVRILFID